MRFPDAQRLIFDRPPVTEVVSQLRFPTILRFDTLPPADFQEAIRGDFPFYAVESPPLRQSAGSTTITIRGAAAGVPVIPVSPKTQVHLFIAADRLSAIRLNNCELSFSCQKYLGWNVFSQKLFNAMDSLVRIYKPVFFHHVCVKYNNAIQRSRLGLQDERWANLLNPAILGPLGADGATDAANLESKFTLNLEDGESIDATVGLGRKPDVEERAFVINSHTYTNVQTRAEDVRRRLSSFHRTAGMFFSWCLQQRLRDAMGPTVVGDW